MTAPDPLEPDRTPLRPDALYHLVTAEEWETHVASGVIRPASLESEGFVHCSWGRQVEATARRHFPGTVVTALELDLDGLDVELVVEDSYGSGEAFPHLYGPVPVSAVVRRHLVG